MWILHPEGGFLSAVQHRYYPDALLVRARIKDDLNDLAIMSGAGRKAITGGEPSTDYPWRVMVTRKAFGDYVAHLARGIDYQNFKHQVGQKDLNGIPAHERAWTYSRVWTDLLALEDLDPNGRPARGGWAP